MFAKGDKNDISFISAKLRPPLYSIRLVQRKKLLATMEQGLDKHIVLLHAPAGYGKTTLLYQWYEALKLREQSVAWLTLEADDKDTVRFLYHILLLVESLSGKYQTTDEAASQFSHNLSLALLQDELIDKLENLDNAATIIIDDYHLAESENNNKILDSLLHVAPDIITFVISSRVKPQISFSYFKCQGRLLEIGVSELKFSTEDGLELLGEGIPQKSAQHMLERTEGWPVALQLARLWISDHVDTEQTDWNIAADVSDITEYMSSEILKKLPDKVVEVLLDTSVLGQVNGDLANFITKRSDCWEIFKSLRMLDALIVPLSSQGGWFRYHHLFAEFLQSRLMDKGIERINQLHKLACDWFLNHGIIEYAVKHACQAGDHQRAIFIIEEAGAVRIGLTGGMPLLRKLIQSLEVKTIYASPRIHLAKIWLLAKEGKVTIARAQYDEYLKSTAHKEMVKEDGYSDLKKESLFVGMMLSEVYEDKDFGKDDIERIELMANDVSLVDHWFQGWVNNFLCIMHIRRGNLNSGLAVNEAAIYHYQQVGSEYGQIFMLLHLSIIHMLLGNLNEAFTHIGKAHDWSQQAFANDVGLISLIKIVRGYILFERNDITSSAADVFSAIEIASKSEGWVEVYVQGYTAAVQIAYSLGGFEEAVAIIERADRVAKERRLPRLAWHAQYLHAEALTLDGQLDDAQKLVEKIQFTTKKTTPDFVTWRERKCAMIALARLSIYRGEAKKVVDDVKLLLAEAEKYGRRRATMELSVILALAHFSIEDYDMCVATLRKALQVAVAEQYKRVFIKEGRMMAHMIKEMIRHVGAASMTKETVNFLAELLTALKSSAGIIEDAADVNILSVRELAVLHELANGSVNKIIARELDLSVATVKFHLGNIYKKLGVGSRTMAVAIARKQDLI